MAKDGVLYFLQRLRQRGPTSTRGEEEIRTDQERNALINAMRETGREARSAEWMRHVNLRVELVGEESEGFYMIEVCFEAANTENPKLASSELTVIKGDMYTIHVSFDHCQF